MLFTFCLSSILFKNCEICFTHDLDLSKPCFVLISYCSIFNDRLLLSLWDNPNLAQPWYSTTFFSFCQYLFEKIFRFFEKISFFWRLAVWAVEIGLREGQEPSQTPKFPAPLALSPSSLAEARFDATRSFAKVFLRKGGNHLKRRGFLPLSCSPRPPWLR